VSNSTTTESLERELRELLPCESPSRHELGLEHDCAACFVHDIATFITERERRLVEACALVCDNWGEHPGLTLGEMVRALATKEKP
jgi:hypothetical protein